jgi:hypothetical protein
VRPPRSIALLLVAAACAATPELTLDPEAHAHLTVAGFREADPAVAELLDGAVAWAVFHGVEDLHGACTHDGLLFRRSAPAHPVRLRCSSAPAAPAGVAYHLLVILADPQDVASLEAAALDLAEAAHISPHDDFGRLEPEPELEGATRWVITTSRESLLFEARRLRQQLELAAPPAR